MGTLILNATETSPSEPRRRLVLTRTHGIHWTVEVGERHYWIYLDPEQAIEVRDYLTAEYGSVEDD